MSTLDVLKAARALISDPARWHQGNWACDAAGNDVEPLYMGAVRWCAAGAINKIGQPNKDVVDQAVNTVQCAIEDDATIFDVNDYGTHAEVLALFDTAIQQLEREAAP